jgi:cell division protein FtsI/penicillin-binding protein 2
VVAERRFGPVIVVLFAVLGALLVRLFQVQVLEHRVWEGEAASLVRKSQLVPSSRGTIRDRNGNVLVEDEAVERVEFVYRDFRRGHPVGIVAHARSTLEMRPVPIPEAFAHLEEWAVELLRLSPKDLDGFKTGGALRTATLEIPASPEGSAEAKEELRASRARDLAFYQQALLGVTKAEKTSAMGSGGPSAASFVSGVASARRTTEDALLERLRADLAKERARLGDLARLLPARPNETPAAGIGLDELLARIEAARVRFEDDAADALFEKAAEFPPGRISSATLARGFDILWIARILRWDRARLDAWAASRRAGFEKDLDEEDVPRILVGAGLSEPDRIAPEILDGLASLYARGIFAGAWKDLEDVQVFHGLSSLFHLGRAPALASPNPSGLPFLDADLRASADAIEDPWLLLGTIAEMAGAKIDGIERPSARDWSQRWREILAKDERLEGDEAHAALAAMLSALEARFGAACDAAIEAALAEGAREHGHPGPLDLSRDNVDRAEQAERFLLKDISSRPVRFANDADYALVHLLERDADLYPGFEVVGDRRRKFQVRDAEGVPIARALIGGVRGPSLREVLSEQQRLADGDDEEALERVSAILRGEERRGTSGIEAMLDAELRGRDGYQIVTSLAEAGSDNFVQPAHDGQDVVLTLDRDLQLAAEETLEHPVEPRDGKPDHVWFANPVGAIVLLSTDGEVLAAASAPRRSGLPPAPGRDLERTFARERTLTRPGFNPPGSSMKPFIAAYALDRLGLDPSSEFSCGKIDNGYGYADRSGTMHCHPPGHNSCNLARALAVSCNATFAQIGERFAPADLLDMAGTFGFGQPTGIRRCASEDGAERRGLHEDSSFPNRKTLPKELEMGQARMRFANGLAVVEATPMQIARAMTGLVTGRLPEVCIVREVGTRKIEPRSAELAVSKRARDIVLRDLEGVTKAGGTAFDTGLDVKTLGFTFACKTGTADTRKIEGSSGEAVDGQLKMRKQTWIVGWFPVEDPKAILVVMLHDLTEASTSTSAIVAAQFLHTPAVRQFLEGGPPAGKVER